MSFRLYCWTGALLLTLLVSACGGLPGGIDAKTTTAGGASSSAGGNSAKDDPPVGADGIDSVRVVFVGAMEHSYRLYATGAVVDAGNAPMVISLHGGGATARGNDDYTGLRVKAASAGFVLLSPEGTSGSWNAGSCCNPAMALGVDHVAAINAMIDDAMTVLSVDPKRVFATGHSNGGMMVYRLACQLSDRIAAIAPNAAVMMNQDLDTDPPTTMFECKPTRPVPVLHMHGLADQCAPFNGGVSAGEAGGMRPPVSESIRFWAINNRCAVAHVLPDYEYGNAYCGSYGGCADGAKVELCTIKGAGHIWPGNGINPAPDDVCGGTGSNDLIANDMLWDFFSRHPMP